MKLKRLVVGKYKNLQSLQIDFSPGEGLSILVGNNGSGKSNILEVISGIFHDLFQAKNKRKISCDYSLEYVLTDVSCKLEQKQGTLRCYAPKRIAKNRFISSYAPNNVIGLYSGEEDRLWTSFYEVYYKTYIRRIFAHEPPTRMRLVFVNKYYWNVALLTLLLSDNDTLKPFIEKDLGIKEVSTIKMTFDFTHFHEANDLLKSFIDKINPKHEAKHGYSLADLKKRITRETHRNELGKEIVEHVGVNDLTTFRLLAQACMPKYKKIISEIVITVNRNVTVERLSEGEKKLILVKTVLEILSDEKTLVLMDEPDAHLHEGRKAALVDMMREYPNRQIAIATHSPVIAQLAREEELIMIESLEGNASLISDEKIGKIKRLTGTAWDVVGQTMMFKSSNPLVVFEGKTDVKYVKRALELLRPIKPEYKAISVDMLNANGAGNIKSFVENLKELIDTSKKVIIFFDRDNAGKDGASSVTGLSKSDERIVHYNDIVQKNLIVSFIPYKKGISGGDFLIEDYFSWDDTLKTIFDELIPENKHPIKNLPNLSARMKDEIEKKLNEFQYEDFEGFIPLLDKIKTLSQKA